MRRHISVFIRACAALFLIAVTTAAQSQPNPQGWDEANALFQARKWAEAAKAYEDMAKTNPQAGRVWYRLGYSLHSLGQYGRAAEAFEKAVAIAPNPLAMYNLACSYARLGNKDKAFEWLTKALNAGFPQARSLTSDPDLASLQSDARMKDVLALAARLTTPCEVTAEYKQFDFWVGEWDVKNPQGQQVGTNSVQRVVDGCIILENWTASLGGTGKSFNYYNQRTGKWHQLWVGSGGGVLEFSGEYKDGAMRYEGLTVARNGTKTIERLTFFNLGSDKVRQFWEQSTDGGKTWTVAFDGTYIRRKGTTGAANK